MKTRILLLPWGKWYKKFLFFPFSDIYSCAMCFSLAQGAFLYVAVCGECAEEAESRAHRRHQQKRQKAKGAQKEEEEGPQRAAKVSVLLSPLHLLVPLSQVCITGSQLMVAAVASS
jgi:hypothetical protein